MVASIGVIASLSLGVAYYEKDGYYAGEDPRTRRPAPGRAGGRGVGAHGSSRSSHLQGRAGRQSAGRPAAGQTGQRRGIHHRPGRDVTLSAPKSVSLMALVGGDDRIVAAHDRAVTRTLAWTRNSIPMP